MRRFDAIIAGSGLAPVLLAALLSKRGVRGVLVDVEEDIGSDTPNFEDYIVTDEDAPLARAVHQELGLREDLRMHTTPVHMQAIYDDERIDLRGALDSDAKEFGRAFDREAQYRRCREALRESDRELDAFLMKVDDFPPTGFFSKLKVRSQARAYPSLQRDFDATAIEDLPEFAALLAGATAFGSDLTADVEERSTASVARIAARWLSGLRKLAGGKTYREYLVAAIRRRGFEVRTAPMDSVDVAGGQFRAAVDGTEFSAEILVDGTRDNRVAKMIAENRKKSFDALLAASASTESRKMIRVDVQRRVLPPHLGELVLMLDRGDDDPPDPLLLFHRTPKEHSRVQLFVQALDDGTRSQELRPRIERRLRALIPFLDQGEPLFFDEAQQVPRYDPLKGRVLGITGLPVKTPVSNLFLCGPSVLPGLGVDGSYMSAILASNAVERVLRQTLESSPLTVRNVAQ